MRSLRTNKFADMNMILSAVVMAIVFAVGIIIVFNVIGSVDVTDLDENYRGTYPGDTDSGNFTWNTTTPVANATNNLLDNVETFYTVGPIALIVVAAVGILGYVMLLRKRG